MFDTLMLEAEKLFEMAIDRVESAVRVAQIHNKNDHREIEKTRKRDKKLCERIRKR